MILPTENKAKVIADFGRNEKDTGSAEVQAALLTKHINELTIHCQANPKDFSSRRGLLQMVNDRKKFLRYIEEKSEEAYKQIISRLGLRK